MLQGNRYFRSVGREFGGFSPVYLVVPPFGREFGGFSPVHLVFLPFGREFGGFSPVHLVVPPFGREFGGFSPVHLVFLPFGRESGSFSPAVARCEPLNGQGAEKQATPCPLTCPRMLSKALCRARSPIKKSLKVFCLRLFVL